MKKYKKEVGWVTNNYVLLRAIIEFIQYNRQLFNGNGKESINITHMLHVTQRDTHVQLVLINRNY